MTDLEKRIAKIEHRWTFLLWCLFGVAIIIVMSYLVIFIHQYGFPSNAELRAYFSGMGVTLFAVIMVSIMLWIERNF